MAGRGHEAQSLDVAVELAAYINVETSRKSQHFHHETDSRRGSCQRWLIPLRLPTRERSIALLRKHCSRFVAGAPRCPQHVPARSPGPVTTRDEQV